MYGTSERASGAAHSVTGRWERERGWVRLVCVDGQDEPMEEDTLAF